MNHSKKISAPANMLESAKIKRLTLVTDAWHPQVNGVVTTLSTLVKHLTEMGIAVDVIQPNDYPNVPLPSYPEIRLAVKTADLHQRIRNFNPDALHIATEGTLGWKARRFALKNNWPFTSSYHTQYPEYVRARWPIPLKLSYAILKRFHSAASRTFVPSESMKALLEKAEFKNLVMMTRGVDNHIFNPQRQKDLGYPRPNMLYVGRVAPEKNIEAFLRLDLPGTKIIVGDGPQKAELQNKYPQVVFAGIQKGVELAEFYASADVFVFPSKTDTFGVVNIEAISCGTPVAAYPVTGPKDIITEGINGALDEDLEQAISSALNLSKNPEQIAASIPEYSWQTAAQQFLQNLAPI